jgi:murein DD-endopeptidase MepM/ murein hydrolase activator NlpD
MTSRDRLVFLFSLVMSGRLCGKPQGRTGFSAFCLLPSAFCLLGLLSPLWGWKNANAAVPGCPTPALSRILRHQVARGETLDSIAQRYNLIPATIIDFNPRLRNGSVAVNSEILIPPFNGIVVEVPRGQTWRQVAAKYKVRADALFEVNGCQKDPRVVFVPGANLSPNRPALQPSKPVTTTSNITTPATSGQLGGYPLPQAAQVALGYGWQINPGNREVFFHSGIDLLSAKGTSVQAIAPGKIVFAGEQGTYGNLVIINHSGGFQTRYAQLDSIKVSIGQSVNKTEEIGTVGTTGQPTTNQPHLHFEVRSSSDLGWVAKDPKDYLKR